MGQPAEEIKTPMVNRDINICEPCYNLEGEMCDTPECVFCFRSIKEIKEILHILMIRPEIDGEILKL